MKLFTFHFSLFTLLLLAGCVNKPMIVTRTDPETGAVTKVHSLGQSLISSEKKQVAYLKDGDVELYYTSEDTDTAAGLRSYVRWKAAPAITKAAADGANEVIEQFND